MSKLDPTDATDPEKRGQTESPCASSLNRYICRIFHTECIGDNLPVILANIESNNVKGHVDESSSLPK